MMSDKTEQRVLARFKRVARWDESTRLPKQLGVVVNHNGTRRWLRFEFRRASCEFEWDLSKLHITKFNGLYDMGVERASDDARSLSSEQECVILTEIAKRYNEYPALIAELKRLREASDATGTGTDHE
jgi:hypothetical protein